MIKKTQQFTIALTLLTSSSLALANTPPAAPPAQDNGRMVSAIQELGNRIEALTKAGVKSVNELAYQLDKTFTASMQLNIKQDDIQTRTRAQTRLDTDHAVKRNLQPFAAGTLTYTNKTQPEVKKVMAESTEQQNFINRLKNLEASDSIYSLVQGMELSTYWTKKNMGSPGRNDDAFNFGALIEADVYSPEEVKNSENFIGIATRQYQSYSDGLDLSQLRSALQKYQQQGVKVLSQKIDEFRNNTAYKNYQLTVRSLTATQSVATDIFSGLAAERKPILTAEADPQLDAISRAIGVEPETFSLKNANGESVTMFRYASPMQIAKYRANYRLNSPQWYQEVGGDSAENLQRKSVVLLAEIASQLYQNHLDNEKMLGALAMLNVQSGDMSRQLLATKVNDVNTAISAFSTTSNNQEQPPETTASSTATSSSNSSSSSYDTSNYDTSNYNSSNINNSTPPPTTVPSQ